jgi:hypothetical protein
MIRRSVGLGFMVTVMVAEDRDCDTIGSINALSLSVVLPWPAHGESGRVDDSSW